MTNPAPDYIQNTPSTDAIHTAPPKAGGEFTTPFTPAALAQIGVQFIAGFLQKVVEAIVGVFVPGVSAFEQLANWAVVQLPALILAPLNALVTILVTVLDSVPVIGPPIGDAITDLANMFGLMKDTTATAQVTGNVAQSSADTANSGVAALNAHAAGTGTVFIDSFDEPAASNLGANYTRFMSSGSGTWGPDGSGNLVWTPAGATSQICADLVSGAAMVTKYQSITVVLTTPPAATHTFGCVNSSIDLVLRSDIAGATFVSAHVDGQGVVWIGYVNSGGGFNQLGAQVTLTGMANGDIFEFRAGVATGGVTEDYQFDLLQNGLTVISRTDSSHLSLNGSAPSTWVGTYDYAAYQVTAGTDVAFFLTAQMSAPTTQILTVADRTP